MASACNPSSQELEAAGSEVQGPPWLHNEKKASPDCMMTLSQKQNQKEFIDMMCNFCISCNCFYMCWFFTFIHYSFSKIYITKEDKTKTITLKLYQIKQNQTTTNNNNNNKPTQKHNEKTPREGTKFRDPLVHTPRNTKGKAIVSVHTLAGSEHDALVSVSSLLALLIKIWKALFSWCPLILTPCFLLSRLPELCGGI